MRRSKRTKVVAQQQQQPAAEKLKSVQKNKGSIDVGRLITAGAGSSGTGGSNNRLDYEHPLLNPMLMTSILEYMNPSYQDLKQVRQVCRLWNDLSLPKWRQTAVLTLVQDAALFQKQCQGMGILNYFKEFQNLQSPYNFSEKPFTRYKLKNLKIDVQACNEEGTDSKLFWDFIGPLVTYVHLEKCVLANTVDKPIMELLVRKMPNVEHLAITDSKVKRKRGALNNAVFPIKFQTDHMNLRKLSVQGAPSIDLKYVFILAPKLETIEGINDEKLKITVGRDLTCDFLSTVSYLWDRENLNNRFKLFPCLKNLDLMSTGCFMPYYNIDVMTQLFMTLKLETFTVAFKDDKYNVLRTPPAECVENFLRSQRKSLQMIKIFKVPINPPLITFLQNIQMTALTELHFLGTVISNFNFLRSVPKLTRLCVNLGCYEKQTEMKKMLQMERLTSENTLYKKFDQDLVQASATVSMNNFSLKDLKHFEIDYDFSGESWKMLGKWMPNLEVLKTILNKNTVPVVCKQWRNLKELVCFHESKIVNANILCGRRGWTIGNLKHLEKFQLDAFCGGTSLSDAAVISGFCKMPALKSLQICVGKKMSLKTETMLKQRFEDCRVIRNYAGGDHSNYDCCEQEKFKKEVADGLPTENRWDEIDSDSDY